MKKAVAMLMIVTLLMCTISAALADRIVEFHDELWVVDSSGALSHRYNGGNGRPIVFKRERVNRNFPANVMRDTRQLCNEYYGQEINCIGIACTAGSNLRSRPDKSGRQVVAGYSGVTEEYQYPIVKLDVVGGSIIGKIGGNETIFVCFSIYATDGDEYYYVIRSSGEEGFVAAKRILVFPDMHYEW